MVACFPCRGDRRARTAAGASPRPTGTEERRCAEDVPFCPWRQKGTERTPPKGSRPLETYVASMFLFDRTYTRRRFAIFAPQIPAETNISKRRQTQPQSRCAAIVAVASYPAPQHKDGMRLAPHLPDIFGGRCLTLRQKSIAPHTKRADTERWSSLRRHLG